MRSKSAGDANMFNILNKEEEDIFNLPLKEG